MTDPVLPSADLPLTSRHGGAATILGHALAAAFVVSGVAGLLGSLPGFGGLAAPVSGWPPIRPLTSTAMIVVGVAVWAQLRSLHLAALSASSVGAILGFVAIIGYVGSFPVPGRGMALASAVILTTGSVTLLVAAAKKRPFVEEDALGVGGLALLALTVSFTIGRAAGLLDPVADELVAGASFQVVLGGFLLGISFLGLVWSRGVLLGEQARWLPPAFGIATALTVFVIWRALDEREVHQLRTLSSQAARGMGLALSRDLAAGSRSLGRAAEWKAGGAEASETLRDIAALRQDVAGLDAVAWADSLGALDTEVPSIWYGAGAEVALRRYAGRTGRLPDSVAFLPLDSAGTRFLIVAPACYHDPCPGAMIGLVRTAEMFRAALSDSAHGAHFALRTATATIVQTGSPPPPGAPEAAELPLALGGVHLTLRAWPDDAMLQRERSALPALVMLLGLVVSALAPLSIALTQKSLRSGRETERKRISGALERATDGIWEWDLVTDSSVHSAAIWRYLGYDAAHVRPTRAAWLALVHPADAGRLQKELERHLSGAAPSFEAEYRVRSREGRWHIIMDRGRVVERTPGGTPTRMLGIKADVTMTRTREQGREAAARRFRDIFDIGFQYQLLLDRSGLVLEVNRHAIVESGVLVEALQGRAIWDSFWWAGHPEPQSRLQAAIAAAARGAPRRYEEQFRDHAGAAIFLEIAVKPFRDELGEPTQLLVEARDLTARRRVETTLQEVDTLTTMGRVAARVAHEINNPLAGIQNSFLLIKGAIPPTHPYFKYVGAIEREISRIAAVTRQLYETYSPDPDATGKTSVATVVGDAIAFLEQVNRAAGVQVQLDLSRCRSVIPLPAAMVRQIVYNVVQNAVEASPPQGIVRVEASSENEIFEIRVRDQGTGIPAEVKARIFEPFFSTKGAGVQTGGMGLGLSLVYRTVTVAGGTIAVEDVEGGGTEFIVRAPLRAPEESEP